VFAVEMMGQPFTPTAVGAEEHGLNRLVDVQTECCGQFGAIHQVATEEGEASVLNHHR
jgi:hypothetical protein